MDYTAGNQGKALQALYDLGVSAKPAYLYDKTKTHLLVTTSGRDRIGFMHSLCDAITTNQGNLLDIKGYKVGREFVSIMLIEVEPACGAAVRSSLSRMSSQGLRVAVLDTQPWLSDTDAPRCREGVTFTGHLHATGLDQAGILIKITELLAQQELDITSIQCNQHQQSSLGKEPQNLFQISGVVRAFSPIDRAVLKSKLIELEHETGIRCGIQETDPDPSFSAFSDTEPKTQRLVKTLTR